MTQVVHSGDEYEEVLNRAYDLWYQHKHGGLKGQVVRVADFMDYWIYVATKERIVNWYTNNE